MRTTLSALVALLVMTGTAVAQSPADTVYNNSNGQVLNVVSGGGPDDSAPSGVAPATTGGTPRESGAGTPAAPVASVNTGDSLPFTGFQAGLVALAGAALLGTGFAMRRAARSAQ